MREKVQTKYQYIMISYFQQNKRKHADVNRVL